MTRLSEVKAERDSARAQCDLYSKTLQFLSTLRPDATERTTDEYGPGRYIHEAYGLTRPCGGIIVTRFIYPNQADSIRVGYLDSIREGYPSSDQLVASRFRQVRFNLEQKERAS